MTNTTKQSKTKASECDFYFRGQCQITKSECDFGTDNSRCNGPQKV